MRISSKSSLKSPPKAIPTNIISNAAQNALQIPEILESIVFWSLHLHYVYDDRCRRVNQLRRVAKVWRTTIDHNPTLRSFAFRDPINTLSTSKTHLATFCRPYCTALEYELGVVTELALSSKKTVGLSEFQKVSHSIATTHGPLIKGFRKKRRVPRFLASDIFVTRPAIESIYLRFSGSSDHDWLEALKGIAKPTDYIHNLFESFQYDYHIESSTGVKAKDLINGIDKSINSFYTLPKGSFLVHKIEVWIGNSELLKEGPQSISGWQIRMLWEAKPWKMREQPWYRVISSTKNGVQSGIKGGLWKIIYLASELYCLIAWVVRFIVIVPYLVIKESYGWIKNTLRAKKQNRAGGREVPLWVREVNLT